MSFADEWDMFPDCSVPVSAPTTKINNADFDKEFEELCKLQRQQKSEREAKAAEEKTKQEAEINTTYGYVETVPSEQEQVAEVAYHAFVEEAEKPKSKKKKKTEEVVEETSDETLVAED